LGDEGLIHGDFVQTRRARQLSGELDAVLVGVVAMAMRLFVITVTRFSLAR
jgi:hypothetical protein